MSEQDADRPVGAQDHSKMREAAAPDLEWLDGGVPRSPLYQDTYFSKAGGLAETRHVFLGGNDLPARWHGPAQFVIGELGFGTGLNFLTTLEALRHVPDAPRLTFLSFELHPLSRDQLVTALDAWPELVELSKALIAAWQPKEGWNLLAVAGHTLVLGVGDARELSREAADQIPGKVDAWYLDGFAPSRNPQLWEEGLMSEVYGLTAEEGTLATYTAAGWVRRNLQGAGFEISKVKGFAGKREMVIGRRPPGEAR